MKSELSYDMTGDYSSKRGVIIAILAGAVLIAAGLAIGLGVGLRSRDSGSGSGLNCSEAGGPTYKSGHGRYRFAAVVADATLCSRIGTEVLARYGGHVVDATVATVICDGVVNAHSSGIGGGDLFIYYDRKSRKATALNARETAPLAATADMFAGAQAALSLTGGKAIAVPGQLKGLWELHRKYGRVAWARLIEPTIRLCREGTPLTEAMAEAAEIVKGEIFGLPMFRDLFDASNKTKAPGSLIYRPLLAATLEAIARDGADAFYNGSLTDSIVAEVQQAGGIINRTDLETYRVDVTEPVTLNLSRDGLTVHSMPPPGSGVVLEYILNILSGYNFGPESLREGNQVLTYHRIIEAMKFAFARRTELGDARFLNRTDFLNMTSPEVGEQIRKMIDDNMTHNTSYYGPTFFDAVKTGTAHFCLLDGEGNVVSVTSSINTRFGSKVVGTRTGIVFNNEMDDFSTPNTTNYYGVPASPTNFIVPGKRPLSSMNPAVVVDADGDVQMVVGAAGGTMITTATALTMMNTLWFNMTVTAAVDAPRLHHQLLPEDVKVETAFPQKIIDGLRSKGHAFGQMGKSVVTAIHRTTDNQLEAVSDYRKWGKPDGF